MLTFGIISMVVLSGVIGFLAGSLSTRKRVRSQEYFQQAIEAAETRGRIEGMTGKPVKPGLEPPRSTL